MLEAIFFDFDGVILESADIKTAAFRELFSSYPDHVETIVRYHEENAGVSRYDKFEYIYKNILRKELSSENKEKLGEKFSELVLDEIKKCPFVPGVVEFLEKYQKKLKLFIVSATPDAELKYLIKERGLQSYFREVHGAPAKKYESIMEIIEKEKLENNKTLFVGDTLTDYQHAKKAAVPFIGRIAGTNPFSKEVETVRDFRDLDKLVEKIA